MEHNIGTTEQWTEKYPQIMIYTLWSNGGPSEYLDIPPNTFLFVFSAQRSLSANYLVTFQDFLRRGVIT